ncbi:MAG: DUF2945 domain-containing protein [Parasphingorhabdus sp.]|nr:DUF2945 domain-containing protein [Parasphingorhabdus sp.]
MSNKYSKSSEVEWDWGSGTATGKVVERFERDVTRTLKDTELDRHSSGENPAYLIRQDDGDEVLKLGSELRKPR